MRKAKSRNYYENVQNPWTSDTRAGPLRKTARALLAGALLAAGVPLSPAMAADATQYVYSMPVDGINALASNRATIVFENGVTAEQITQFVADYALLNIEVVMQVPLINGVVVKLPIGTSITDLVNDPIVRDVQLTEAMDVLTMQASGEGGAGEGGATSYIQDFPVAPNNKNRPWGVLNTLVHPYDPNLYLDSFNKKKLHPKVQEILSYTATIDIAVFDTGVDASSTELNSVSSGIDLLHMTSGIPLDDNGHGTHITGTLVSSQFGLVPKARVHAVKILDQNAAGDSSTLVMALQWALDNGIEIVNMSVGFRDDNELVRTAIENARAQGLIMVAAVGNASNWVDGTAGTGEGGAGEGGAGEGGAGEGGAGACTDPTLNCTPEGRYPVMYPALYPGVIGVAAMDPDYNLALFSNDGPEVDVIAPGVDIVSTNLGNSYGISNGTSMATPHVTAAVSLLLAGAASVGQTLSPQDIDDLLSQMNAVTGGILDLEVLADVAIALIQSRM